MTAHGGEICVKKKEMNLRPNVKVEDMKRTDDGGLLFPSVKPNMSQVFITRCVCMEMSRHLTWGAAGALLGRRGVIFKQGKVTLYSVWTLGCAAWEMCRGKINTLLPLCFMLTFILTAAHERARASNFLQVWWFCKFSEIMEEKNNNAKYLNMHKKIQMWQTDCVVQW